MKVLVVVASKHGATLEIAQAIRDTLASAGLDADLLAAEQADGLEAYDAVVLGSAVYMGRWLAPARAYVERHSEALAARHLWLFSSGPLGDPPRPLEDPSDIARLVDELHAHEHKLFAGKLDRDGLSFGDKAIVIALHAPYGDFRDFDAVREWASGIARTLQPSPSRENVVP